MLNKPGIIWWKSTCLLFFFILGAIIAAFPGASPAKETTGAVYVGSETCGQCHEEEFENFSKHSKKASSFEKIKKMQNRNRLTPAEYKECLSCHTTGYGKPGGFISEAQTPELKNAGCEVCHGPGGNHVESQDAEDIKGDLNIEECLICHNEKRVAAFGFRPLLHGGGH